MAWCEATGLQYVFGLPGSKPLSRKVEDTADAVRTARATGDKPVVRDYAETRHKAGSWNRERRAVARIEATRLGLDIRFVVTNVERGSPEWVYDSLYCARGQAENLIKRHKSQLRSDRTSCRSALANQVRLVLHTAAYWLMLDIRDAIRPDTAILYRVPLPDGLDGVRAVRTMTTTLAWFSPVNPRHQGYRKAALDVSAASDDKFWVTDDRTSSQPTDKAVVRGTVVHEHRSGEAATVFVDGGDILLRISCRSAAGELGEEIPFALAVSFEVNIDAGIPVYEQVRERVDIAIQSRIRSQT